MDKVKMQSTRKLEDNTIIRIQGHILGIFVRLLNPPGMGYLIEDDENKFVLTELTGESFFEVIATPLELAKEYINHHNNPPF